MSFKAKFLSFKKWFFHTAPPGYTWIRTWEESKFMFDDHCATAIVKIDSYSFPYYHWIIELHDGKKIDGFGDTLTEAEELCLKRADSLGMLGRDINDRPFGLDRLTF